MYALHLSHRKRSYTVRLAALHERYVEVQEWHVEVSEWYTEVEEWGKGVKRGRGEAEPEYCRERGNLRPAPRGSDPCWDAYG